MIELLAPPKSASHTGTRRSWYQALLLVERRDGKRIGEASWQ
jgi:hypothetical protein